MFYDERIHAGRGKAFRNTLILAVILLAVYGTIHAVCLFLLHDLENPLAIIIEPVCLLAGLSIIIYGEVSFGGKDRDEMQAYQKNCYYAKAFYVFLYIFAGMYCVFAPIQSVFLSGAKTISHENGMTLYQTFFKPNMILSVVELPCWTFLLLQFKRSELPLNAAFLAEDGKTYWRRVWENILKFGAYCIGFGLTSLGASVIYTAATGTHDMILNAAIIVAILLAGGLTWFSISFEYFVFSAAERISDRAKLGGQISIMTMVFYWISVGTGLISSALSFILTVLDLRYTARIAQLTLPIFNSLSTVSSFCGTMFVIYLMSELQPLRDRRLTNVFSAELLFGIVSGMLSTGLSLISLTFGICSAHASELILALTNAQMYVNMLFMLLGAVLAVMRIYLLYRHDLARKWYCVLPLLPVLVVCVAELPEMGFLYDYPLKDGLNILSSILFFFLYTGIWRKLRTSPLPVGEAADENVSADVPFEEAVSE